MLKNWCFWTMVLEKTLESSLVCKEIKPVNPKGNQPWIFIGTTDAEAPILWPLDAKSRLIEKESDAGKDWRQEEKRMTEDKMVAWHHRLIGHEFEQALGNIEDRSRGGTEDKMIGWHHLLNAHEVEQAPGIGDGKGSLACCSPWSCKQLDMTWQLSNSWIKKYVFLLMDTFLDILMDTFASSPNIFYSSILLIRMYNKLFSHTFTRLGSY